MKVVSYYLPSYGQGFYQLYQNLLILFTNIMDQQQIQYRQNVKKRNGDWIGYFCVNMGTLIIARGIN